MNMFDKDYDKKGFDVKSIQSPILQLYKNAKQEVNQYNMGIFSPNPSSSNLQSGKKSYQQQLQPLQMLPKDDSKDNKFKVNSRPASDKMQHRDQQKPKIFQIQKDELNQIEPHNIHNYNNKINGFTPSSQSPLNFDLGFHKLSTKNSEDVSPTTNIFNQPPSRNSHNQNEKNQKEDQSQPSSNIKVQKLDNDQKIIQQIQSPKMRIKTIPKNIKSPTYQNIQREKASQEDSSEFDKQQVSNFEKQANQNFYQKPELEKQENSAPHQDLSNQEEELSPQKFSNQQNKIQQSNGNGVERILHKITSGDKVTSKQEISRPSSGRNQNFIIKTVNAYNYQENHHNHGYAVNNGSSNISRLQSKETSDTPKSQAKEEKSQESSTEIQNNKNKIENLISQQQTNPSLQALEEEVKNENEVNDQKQNNPTIVNQNITQKISSLNHIIEVKQSLNCEGESSPVGKNIVTNENDKSGSKNTLSEQSQRHRQESSMMLSEKREVLGNGQKNVENNYNSDFLDAQMGELLGQGAYGKVYKGFIKSRGKFVAIKEMKEEQMLGDDAHSLLESIYKEIQLLKQLSHKNIVNYIGSKKQEGSVYIYMEYMPGGSISEMLKKYGGFDEEVIQKFVKQLLEGLVYLHSKGVIHRDLKGANILSDGQGNVKLADFGAARNIENILQHSLSQSEFCNSIKGSLYWMAPELIKNEKHGRRIDVWSLGCTIIEMASAQHPWENIKKFSELANAVIEQQPIPIPSHLSEECKDFISQCCTYDKKIRPKSHQLQNHPFLFKTFS